MGVLCGSGILDPPCRPTASTRQIGEHRPPADLCHSARPTAPLVRDDHVDVSGVELSHPNFPFCRDQHLDANGVRWGSLSASVAMVSHFLELKTELEVLRSGCNADIIEDENDAL
jgi:hypothetical protein